MKIILSAASPSIDAPIDPRFGRGAYLIVVDPNTMEWTAHPNPGVGASGGAGTLTAQFVAQQQVRTVVSGDFGPNAYATLQAAGVEMRLFGTSATVREAVERYKAGTLESIDKPSKSGRH